MNYIVYKTTNTVNGHFYIGIHECVNISDGYLGSGKLVEQAVKKYGRVNFTKEILHVFTNREEMLSKEAELVNEEFVKRQDTYNLASGGGAGLGFGHLTKEQLSAFGKLGARANRGTKHTEETKKKWSEQRTGKKYNVSPEASETKRQKTIARNKLMSGINHPRNRAKLTPEQVLQIRSLQGTQKALGEKFGVAPATIWRIKANIAWPHL